MVKLFQSEKKPKKRLNRAKSDTMFNFLGVNDQIKLMAETNLNLRETKKIEESKSKDGNSQNILQSSGDYRLIQSVFNQSQSEI